MSTAGRAQELRRIELRRIAGDAWRFRRRVELEAHARFRRLEEQLAAVGAAPDIVALAARSARDEARHAERCAEWAREYGEHDPAPAPLAAAEIAPAGLSLRGRVLYELVAACCITETESMAVLTTLLDAAPRGRMRRTLQELAADEVHHSRLGWAHLASEYRQGVTSFLSPLVPAMLRGSMERGLFRPAPDEREDAALLEHGVLPHALKREVFTHALEEVVFPGLESFGVDAGPARSWLEERIAELKVSAAAP